MRSKFRLFQSFGLKRKALVIFLLLVIVPTLGVGVVVQYKYGQILHEQFVDSTIRNLDAVANQLEEQTSMIEDIANYLIFDPALNAYLGADTSDYNEQRQSWKETVEGFLTFHLMSKTYIRSLAIEGYNGGRIEIGEPVTSDETRWLEEAAARQGRVVWSEGYTARSAWNGEVRVVSLFRVLNEYRNVSNPRGNLTIRLDESSIIRLLENQLYQGLGKVYVLGPAGERVVTTSGELQEDLVPQDALASLNERRVRYQTYEAGGQSYMTFSRQMPNTGWTILTAIPESTVNAQSVNVRLIMGAVLLAILLLAVLALVGFHYTIIRPILRLKNETNRVKLGDFSARVPVESKDEISDLNRKFNEMVLTIQQLIDHKYKLEIRERESELKLLQSQMDPHFLYNTLDMIRWTARLEKAGRTSQLIETLSRFFRSALSNGQYTTTIRQELEFVEAYLYLQQRRLGSRFRYALYTEHQIADAALLKTTIQPLVENFIKHGLNRKDKDNFIAVRCYKSGTAIHIDVEDNGQGIAPDQLERLRAALAQQDEPGGRSGALRNIHERLSIYFGSGCGLQLVASEPGGGTLVRLTIPDSNQWEGERLE
ncbi:sensor histidine kinase [Paenibacillus sp. IB182496]|uniref:histidine kinase n=1 Tax=Paenibacillus sabuli TaxID=2772509 RepID=A0A927GS03_9BACL|nr:sensor histidine kinase [Paenibacillus sabuli]MBD2845791.1 sensor histidine kinase [Paenibacillus sabuli]